MGSLTVIESGICTTIQDRGRWDYRDSGVAVSGAMDLEASSFINRLLNNHLNDAVLEMTLRGATLLCNHPTYIAVTGIRIAINGESVSCDVPHKIGLGDKIELGNTMNGNYGYLAIKDGFQSELVLESRSMMKAVTTASQVHKGDQLTFKEIDKDIKIQTLKNPIPEQQKVLKAHPGPEWNLLDRSTQEQLLTHDFKLGAQCNRMAFRAVTQIHNPLKPIASSPVLPGTVQWTPDGELLILMRDAQTTGGYPRILQLTVASVNKLVQMGQKDIFSVVII